MRRALPDGGTAEALLAIIVDAARAAAGPDVRAWGVAVPGPFDYERGISTIRGVAKLDALYAVDLRAHLARATGVQPDAFRFVNDASAFLIGEHWVGAARGSARAIGVTLGTGLGSAFLANGTIVEDLPHEVPPEGRLDLLSFRGRPVEETLSRRGLRAAYGLDDPDVHVLAQRARDGERRAAQVLAAFGSALGEFLAPWVERFAPTCVVIGGAIARSWDLWSADFRSACSPDMDMTWYGLAEHLDEAPLLGAALHATRR